MELLFLWLDNSYINFKNTTFNFSNRYKAICSVEYGKKAKIEIEEYSNYIPNFFNKLFVENQFKGSNVVNVTGIIGENGIGKTNLCLSLIDILNIGNITPYNYMIGFKSLKINEIIVYSNLVDVEHEFIASPNIKLKSIFKYVKKGRNYIDQQEEIVKESISFYYNPIFDLKGYPQAISNKHKSYIDISTNSLIEDDVIDSNESYDSEDKILLYKYANVERQFEFISNSNDFVVNTLNLPTEIIISIRNVRFNESIRQIKGDYLNYFNSISDKINSTKANLVRSLEAIKKDIENNNTYSSLDDFFKAISPDEKQLEDLTRVRKELLRLNFLSNLFNNLFINLHNSGFQTNIGDLKEADNDGLYEALEKFYSQINWLSKINSSSVRLYDFYRKGLEIIDKVDTTERILEDEISFVCSIEDGRQILKIHREYISSIPSTNKQGVLYFNWRDISSGEKALLDLYSRLYFGLKNKLKEKEIIISEKFNFIYLFVDEGEMGFHPQWQKEYLYNLLKFVKIYFKDVAVQVFITSHSPFIISDLPKQNLIFLQKNGPFTEIAELDENVAFASNIHTLYTNSYFIKGGIKGKFSEEWLNKELKDLFSSKKKINIDRIRKVISLIGEPVLRSTLNDLLDKREKKYVSDN
jgi:predicted ATPase